MRSTFKFVAYWNPSLKTDSNGKARVEFQVPDNLTGWRVLAMAVTPGDLMGLARSWAERDIAYSSRAFALAKRLINRSFERNAGESADAEAAAQVELLHSPEFLGRVRALKDSGEI